MRNNFEIFFSLFFETKTHLTIFRSNSRWLSLRLWTTVLFSSRESHFWSARFIRFRCFKISRFVVNGRVDNVRTNVQKNCVQRAYFDCPIYSFPDSPHYRVNTLDAILCTWNEQHPSEGLSASKKVLVALSNDCAPSFNSNRPETFLKESFNVHSPDWIGHKFSPASVDTWK